MANPVDEERILILAPVGRDAPLLQISLTQGGFPCTILDEPSKLATYLGQGIGVLLLTAEALQPNFLQALPTVLATQPTWSNLPVVLLVNTPQYTPLQNRLQSSLGPDKPLTLLTRPVPTQLLMAVMQTSLWLRRRQYEIRDLLAQLVAQNANLAHEVTEHQATSAVLRQREEHLRVLNATLEQRVAERTAELEQRNAELDEFAYVASHDLKAPLRAIRHLANWIRQDATAVLPGPSQRHLIQMDVRIQRMQKLLDDLLAYSRAGREHRAPERVELGALVHELRAQFAPPPGFTVVAANLPTLLTERVPLETVLRNLIGNAIKHHHRPTTGQIHITLVEQPTGVEFTVEDDGPGIDPRFHARIFQVFQTLQPRDDVEGSGMGLAIVKKLIETRGGTIRVESSLGQGTTFRFTWPGVLPTAARAAGISSQAH